MATPHCMHSGASADDRDVGASASERWAANCEADGTVGALLGGLAGRATVRGDRLELRTEQPTADLHRLTAWALERGLELDDLEVVRPTLEDVYLDLVGDDTGSDGEDGSGG